MQGSLQTPFLLSLAHLVYLCIYPLFRICLPLISSPTFTLLLFSSSYTIPSHYLFVSFILRSLPHPLPFSLHTLPSTVWVPYTFQLIISQAVQTASALFVAPGTTGRPCLPQCDLHKQPTQSDNADLKWPQEAGRQTQDWGMEQDGDVKRQTVFPFTHAANVTRESGASGLAPVQLYGTCTTFVSK